MGEAPEVVRGEVPCVCWADPLYRVNGGGDHAGHCCSGAGKTCHMDVWEVFVAEVGDWRSASRFIAESRRLEDRYLVASICARLYPDSVSSGVSPRPCVVPLPPPDPYGTEPLFGGVL